MSKQHEENFVLGLTEEDVTELHELLSVLRGVLKDHIAENTIHYSDLELADSAKVEARLVSFLALFGGVNL